MTKGDMLDAARSAAQLGIETVTIKVVDLLAALSEGPRPIVSVISEFGETTFYDSIPFRPADDGSQK